MERSSQNWWRSAAAVATISWALFCTPAAAQDDILNLIDRISAAPVATDVDRVAELIARGTEGDYEARLEAALRTTLQSVAGRPLALAALGKWPAQELELDLVSLLPSVQDTPPPDLDLLLTALARSGAGAARNTISGLVDTPNQAGLFAAHETRRQFWRTLFALDPPEALFSALRFTRSFGPLDQPTADFLRELIQSAARNRDLLPRCFRAFQAFLGVPSHVFPPPDNPVLPSLGEGSPVQQIQRAILDALLSMRSPLALDLVAAYADSDSPSLSALAQAADFTPVQRAPWLLPASSVVLNPFGSVPGNAGKLLRRLPIGAPRELPFIPELKFDLLARYEASAVAAGASAPDRARAKTTQDLFAEQNAMVRSVVASIANAYGETLSPNLPPDPGDTPPEVDLGGRRVRYGSIGAIDNLAGTSVAPAVAAFASQEPARTRTIAFMMSKEWERRALVLYSLVAASRKLQVTEADVDVAKADTALDDLLSRPSTAAVIVTKVVPEIVPTTNAPLPIACPSATVSVDARELSLTQGLYVENLTVVCEGLAPTKVSWVGSVPVPLMAALVRHPRILDYPNVSLAVRELKLQVNGARPLLEDIDYVRVFPLISIPYLTAALMHVDVPWRDVKDTLIYELYQQTDLWNPTNAFRLATQPPALVEVAAPASLRSLPHGLPSSSVLPTSAYDDLKTLLDQKFQNFTAVKGESDVARQLRLVVDQRLPNTTYSCIPYTLPNGSGTSCADRPYQPKGAVLYQIDAEIANLDQAIAPLQEWDISVFRQTGPQRVEVIRTYVVADYSRALMLYRLTAGDGRPHYLALESTVSGFPRWASGLLTHDPSILTRFGIDLGNATTDSSAVLAYALQRSLRDDALSMPILTLLNRTGLLPLVHGTSHLDVARGPLLNGPEGRIRLAELALFERIMAFASGAAVFDAGVPKPEFSAKILSMQQQIDAANAPKIQSKVDTLWAGIQQSINQATGWSFGVNLTLAPGLPPVFGFNFSVGPIALNLSSAFHSDVIVTGSWNNHGIPFSLDLPLASTPASTPPPVAVDVALTSRPTEIASAGSVYAPQLSPAPASSPSPANALLGRPSDPPATVTWELVPVWGPLPTFGPATPETREVNILWFRGLLGRAAPLLTPEEWAQVNGALQSGTVSPSMQAMLYARANQAVEQENIERRLWLRTSRVDQLIPQDGAGHIQPLPAFPGLAEDDVMEKWIEVKNDQFSRQFNADLARARTRITPAKPLVEGVPAVRITYGNNFRVMQFEYQYLLTEGGSLSRSQLSRTPPWILDDVRQHPDDHIYEMYFTAAVASMLSSNPDFGSRPDMSMIVAGELRKLQEANRFLPNVTRVLEGIGGTIVQLVQPSVTSFLDSYRAWAQAHPSLPVDDPYQPPIDATPMLNFLPSPFEWYERRNEPIQDILIFQRSSSFGTSVATGTMVVIGPDPGVP